MDRPERELEVVDLVEVVHQTLVVDIDQTREVQVVDIMETLEVQTMVSATTIGNRTLVLAPMETTTIANLQILVVVGLVETTTIDNRQTVEVDSSNRPVAKLQDSTKAPELDRWFDRIHSKTPSLEPPPDIFYIKAVNI